MERFAQRYPDVAADDEEAFYGRLSDEFDRIDRSDAAQRELGELLAGDPRSAGFLMVMRRGGNPMEYLIEQYGDDFREALNDETKAKEFSAAFSKYAEKQAKDKELQAQAEANMQRMLAELDNAKAEGSFTDDDAVRPKVIVKARDKGLPVYLHARRVAVLRQKRAPRKAGNTQKCRDER